MDLLTLIVVLALIGLALWLVTTYIPMPEQIKRLIVIVAVVMIVLWILQALGLIGSLRSVRLQ